jgi:hypothetical protein
MHFMEAHARPSFKELERNPVTQLGPLVYAAAKEAASR